MPVAQNQGRVHPPAAEQAAAGFYAPFSVEKEELMRSLPCTWVHNKSAPTDTTQYDFGCHAGTWGTVSLYLNEARHDPGYISAVRLIWREWQAGNPYSSDKPVAQKFLKEVTERFTSPQLATQLAEDFFGQADQTYDAGPFLVTYTFTTGQHQNTHRLSIGLSQ